MSFNDSIELLGSIVSCIEDSWSGSQK